MFSGPYRMEAPGSTGDSLDLPGIVWMVRSLLSTGALWINVIVWIRLRTAIAFGTPYILYTVGWTGAVSKYPSRLPVEPKYPVAPPTLVASVGPVVETGRVAPLLPTGRVWVRSRPSVTRGRSRVRRFTVSLSPRRGGIFPRQHLPVESFVTSVGFELEGWVVVGADGNTRKLVAHDTAVTAHAVEGEAQPFDPTQIGSVALLLRNPPHPHPVRELPTDNEGFPHPSLSVGSSPLPLGA